MKDDLPAIRMRINELDRALIEILKKRREAIVDIAEIKNMQGIEVLDSKRWQEILDTRRQWAKELGVEDELVKNIFEKIHAWSIGIQKSQNGEGDKNIHV